MAPLLFREFVYVETFLLNCSIATAVRITSLMVAIPLLLRASITLQQLLFWIHASCFEQIRNNILKNKYQKILFEIAICFIKRERNIA
jgi:hypothetical protein